MSVLEFMGRAPIGGIEKQHALTTKIEEAERRVRSTILGECSVKLLREVIHDGSFWDEDGRNRLLQFEDALRARGEKIYEED